MSDSRAFASLSPSLLARKGAAKPAMRPQAFAPLAPAVEDLGWDDMGTSGSACAPRVLEQQRRLEQVFQEQRRPPQAAAAPTVQPKGCRARAAFTLRLDSQRHLKLRLASAVTHRSAQQLLTEALDRMLESMPEAEKLAGHVAICRTEGQG